MTKARNGGGTDAELTRRAFFKRTGVSAVGAALLDTTQSCTPMEEPHVETRVLGPGPVSVDLTLNGRQITQAVDPATTLLELIRDGQGLTGTKQACDRGVCAACTVWVDGEVCNSCMLLALDVRGKQVTTIEGLAKGDQLHPIQQAFVDYDALQCGFCTPGMLMSCAALIDRNAGVGIEEVKTAVSAHVCRCGTYPNVFKATLAAASRKRSHG
jgi:xanthine dehydrogenase YagT iron-sulfur-binding subunit